MELQEATRKDLIDELVSRCESIVIAASWYDPDECDPERRTRQKVCVGNGLECLGLVRLLDDYALSLYYKNREQ